MSYADPSTTPCQGGDGAPAALAVCVIIRLDVVRNRDARKLFIVESGNERLYKSLVAALSNEPDVEVFYDRRKSVQSERRYAEDRRTPSDVEERIQRDGFAVVRIAPRTAERGNLRWPA